MKQASHSQQEPKHSHYLESVSSLYLDKATKQKIQRHLNDINDVITEEDIRNIDTSVTLSFRPRSYNH